MRKIIFATLLATPLLASANLVTNGSFEAEVIPSDTFSVVSNLTGWTGTPNIELRNNVAGAAFAGVNFVELDTFLNSGMFQDIATITGASYTLSFVYSPRPNTGNTNGIDVLWNGALLEALSGVNSGATHNWTTYTYNLLGGLGATSRVSFNATGVSDSFGGSLDNVNVSQVPEPSTYAILLAGIGAMVFSARRRKQQQ